MLNLSHALSLTELKVYSLVNYAIVWYFIYNALKLVQQDGVLRLKITTVLFYATVPTSLATYLLVEAFQGLNGLLNSVHIHFLLLFWLTKQHRLCLKVVVSHQFLPKFQMNG